MKNERRSFLTEKMNTYKEIKQLVDSSNRDYIYQFIEYVKGKISRDCELELREYAKEYTSVGINEVSKCPYIIKRGVNNGKQCLHVIRDNSKYCTKHRKYVLIDDDAEEKLISIQSDNEDELEHEIVDNEDGVVVDGEVEQENDDESNTEENDNFFYEYM
jgi:hypothetical protein